MAMLRWIFAIWLFANTILLGLASAFAADVEPDFASCVLPELEQHPVRKAVESEPWAQRHLKAVRMVLCALIEGTQTDWTDARFAKFQKRSERRKLAERVWNSQGIFWSFCKDEFFKELQKAKTPETIQMVTSKYCRDYSNTWSPMDSDFRALVKDKNFEGAKLTLLEGFQELEKRYTWFLNEFFCQVSEYVVSRYIEILGGVQGLYNPDLPAVVRFKEQTQSLCNELRKDEIAIDEAAYRWSQELKHMKQRVGPELETEIVRGLVDFLSGIASLVK